MHVWKPTWLGKALKISKATDVKQRFLREMLQGAWLTAIKPRSKLNADQGLMQPVLYASDSFIAIRVPWGNAAKPDDLPPEGWIPPEALKAIEAMRKDETVTINKTAIKRGRVTFNREPPKTGIDQKTAEFADIEALIPKSNPKMDRRLYIGFNATFLKNLAMALATEGLEVEINLDDIVRPEGAKPQYLKPLVVRPLDRRTNDDMRIGLQMPIRLERPRKDEAVHVDD